MVRMTPFLLFCGSLPLLVFGQSQPKSVAIAEVDQVAHYMLGRAEAGFSGAVLITRGNQIILREGYGFADHENKVKNTPATLFRIGSVTKPMVATAMLRLFAQNRLSLDDPLSKYLPELPKGWHRVRIKDVLSHTSGIPDLFGQVASGSPGDLLKFVDEILAKSKEVSLRSEPGTRYSYNNFGYLLLACVIEIAGDGPWLEVMKREVFSPATLQQTRYDDVWEIVPGRARGYQRKQGDVFNTKYKDHGAFSAGGLLSTVDDLHRFVLALTGGDLLPVEIQQRMLTPVLKNYALGLQVTQFYGRTVINHSGGIGGFSSHIAFYPEYDLFITVLSNQENESVKAMACDLAAQVFGTHPTVLDQNLPPKSDLSWFEFAVGKYVDENGEMVRIVRKADRLKYERGSRSDWLIPIGFRRLILKRNPGVTLDFGGQAKKPSEVVTARTCGSIVFTAHRQKH